ncbi:MAG: DUF2066 domain-containing protein [Porticoccaceae bacterium]|nr:DUF2066 domain-containing protein [Porticoccaceae bacterium]
MKKIILITLLLTLGLSPVAMADSAAALYSAVVPVADNSATERNRALRAGLLEVLVKLTGSADIGSRPEVKQLLAGASAYVVEFGYIKLANQRQGLNVRYSQMDIDRFLRQKQLPVWPAKRPSLLVWVIKESSGQPQSFVFGDDEEFYAALNSIFDRRGLVATYPLYDLEDLSALSMDAAWNLEADKVAAASARYGAASWLLVRCYETSARTWRLTWVLGSAQKNQGDQVYLDNLDDKALDAALTRVVDMAVDRIASTYVYTPSLTADKLIVTVDGISSFNYYNQLLDLLKELSIVKSLNIESVQGEKIRLHVDLEGDAKQFFESLALFDQLEVPEELPTDGQPATIQWLLK